MKHVADALLKSKIKCANNCQWIIEDHVMHTCVKAASQVQRLIQLKPMAARIPYSRLKIDQTWMKVFLRIGARSYLQDRSFAQSNELLLIMLFGVRRILNGDIATVCSRR